MFGVLSTLLKYIFITIIYLFIYSIIRLIYLDIRTVNAQGARKVKNTPYLKLINRRESLEFRVSETYALEKDVIIGRNRDNAISIQDPYLSGVHASISLKEGNHYLRDLGSTNGTFVNGRQNDGNDELLKDGDRIHAGNLDFLYVGSVQ